MKQGFFSAALFLLLFLLSCGGGSTPDPVNPDPEPDPKQQNKMEPINPMGYDVSGLRVPFPDSTEYVWYPDSDLPYEEVIEYHPVETINDIYLYTHLHRPAFSSAEKPCHGLVLIPGGIQRGVAWHQKWRRANADNWAKAGFIVIDFDFEGRGNSPGEEDMYGPNHREDLRAVIEYMNSRDDVLPNGVGIVTSSWGITVASAALAQYPELNVRFLVDLEGSQDRYVSTRWNDPFWVDLLGMGHTTADDEYWDPREAITFQPGITVPYIRIQSDMDHALDYFYIDHAAALVNAAVNGLSTYSRLNHNKPDLLIDVDNPQNYTWEEIDGIDIDYYNYVLEAAMTVFPGE
ncbi:MAG TPA: CocE/NonD family hydrolase [bacterium]